MNDVANIVTICSDSQAAIKAVIAPVLDSKAVMATRNALNALGTQYEVILCWSPAHMGIRGNERADTLANIGSDTAPHGPAPFLPFAGSFIRKTINASFLSSHLSMLSASGNMDSLHLRLTYNHLQTHKYNLCTTNKHHIRTISHLFTGHSYLRYFQNKIGHEPSGTCRNCEEVPETTEHFLLACPAHIMERFGAMGIFTLRGKHGCLSHSQVTRFAESVKYLDYFDPP